MATPLNRKFRPGRCDYCQSVAVASVEFQTWYSRMGQRSSLIIVHRACLTHLSVPHWHQYGGEDGHIWYDKSKQQLIQNYA